MIRITSSHRSISQMCIQAEQGTDLHGQGPPLCQHCYRCSLVMSPTSITHAQPMTHEGSQWCMTKAWALQTQVHCGFKHSSPTAGCIVDMGLQPLICMVRRIHKSHDYTLLLACRGNRDQIPEMEACGPLQAVLMLGEATLGCTATKYKLSAF